MKNSSWAIMLLALMLTAGCSKDATDQTNNANDPTSDAADPSGTSGRATEQPSNADSAAAVGDSAEAAVQAVMNGMSEGNATVVWAALPAGYQKDINEIVQAFGNGMDPNQWQQIQEALARVHAVLSTKADFIVNVPDIQGMEQSAQLKDAIPKIAGLLKTVMDHTDLESLRSFDGQVFFSGPASSLVAQVDALSKLSKSSPDSFSLSSLKDATVETISSEGDKATLKITNPMDGAEAEEVEFVKVDGRWVPADMADGWESNMAEAKADLTKLPETSKQNAMMVAMMTNAVVAGLQPLEAAEDQEQFNVAVEQLKTGMGQMLGPMLFGGFPGGGETTPIPGETTEFPSDFEPPEADEAAPTDEVETAEPDEETR